jgi:ureidoglycolate dehydrogenase (NAD+)
MKKNSLISSTEITKWTVNILVKIGLAENDATIIANSLVTTSLWGIDSHGIARITHYLTRFENGTINKKPKLNFIKTAAATSKLDGNDGHGIVIMTKATECAIDLAKEAGVGIVGIQNSSHCGAIGLYSRQITDSGMVGIVFTHADSLVVPFGGNKPFFGTNPISVAFPTENRTEPICLDMATSVVPWNFIINARRENKNIEYGIGVDKNGTESIDPNEIVGVFPMAGHKGYGLAFVIDMLCGPLNGMNFGPNMTSMYKDLDKKRKLGSLVIAIDPLRFGGKDKLRNVGTQVIDLIKNYGDNVLFPGQPEYISATSRKQFGIPVTEAMRAEFDFWSKKLNQPLLKYTKND